MKKLFSIFSLVLIFLFSGFNVSNSLAAVRWYYISSNNYSVSYLDTYSLILEKNNFFEEYDVWVKDVFNKDYYELNHYLYRIYPNNGPKQVRYLEKISCDSENNILYDSDFGAKLPWVDVTSQDNQAQILNRVTKYFTDSDSTYKNQHLIVSKYFIQIHNPWR
ncbi:MAG: hypothetical protein ACP5OE_00785 [Thermodesulfobium sp.]